MILKPPTPEDVSLIQQWLTDDELVRLTAIEQPCFEKPYYPFIVQLDSGEKVGWVELFNIDLQNHKAELGIALPGANGSGLSVRAARKVIRFAFEDLGLHRIVLRIPEGNKVSVGLAEKYGFTKEGVERDACLREGKWENIVVYGLVKE